MDDVVLLSRLQFALTIMFHYLFPPLTIGLSVVLVYLMAMHLRTGQAIYETAAKFWTKIFGLNFALGVATGIVMEFQFGTNWAVYSRFVGDVFGSALAAEGIFAFFLESGFLAVLLFGWDRVSRRMHLLAALLVCIGSIFSSIWITVANSWQQTPAGHEIREHTINGQVSQRAEIVDFWAMVFNPSSVQRLVHVWLGALTLGTFFVMSISAWYLLKGRHTEFARRSFTGALLLATIACLAQGVSGDLQARIVATHQPAKLAAFEGHYKSQPRAGLHLWGWPDDHAQTVKWSVKVPAALSLLVHHDADKAVAGLDELEPVWGSPPVWLSFQSFHIMVAIGVAFIVLTLYASAQRWLGTLYDRRWLMWVFVIAVIPAFIANELGWVAAEVGRQPWIVYPRLVGGKLVGGLRTSDAISETVQGGQVFGSIIMFSLIYLLLFILWITLLNHKIHEGPKPVGENTAHEHGILDAAAERRRESMTRAKQES